jgi:hypothetical protein
MTSILEVEQLDTLSSNASSTLTIGGTNTTTIAFKSGATFSNITQGITGADMWRINSNQSLSAGVETAVTANWEQVDTDSFTPIGSSMTQSSGIFTFPTTGIWQITYYVQFNGPSQGATYAGGAIFISTDNFSTEDRATEIYSSMYHPNSWCETVSTHIFDVTNTSTHKCKFYALCEFACTLWGSTDKTRTGVTFIRLGDT